MKKKSIGFIIGLMGFALLGVMSMQLYFLRQSYQMQSDLFDRSVNDALNKVVSKLAKQVEGKVSHRTFVVTATSHTWKTNQPVKRKLTARERRLNLLRDSLKKAIL